MRYPLAPTFLLLGLVSLGSCAGPSAGLPVTAQEQSKLTPDEVLGDLMDGNRRFMAGDLREQDIQARVAASAKGQYPKAVVLSCLDSRVPVEQVFDQGIGDLFVGRVAGNVENDDLLGSMEFAAKLSGVKLVLVLGHSNCGAVKGACDGAQMGHLTTLLAKIQPAVDAVDGFAPAARNSKNDEFVARVVDENVRRTVQDIRSQSPILLEMERAGEIRIVGAVYSLETGEVRLL